jgi:hypothetical protein
VITCSPMRLIGSFRRLAPMLHESRRWDREFNREDSQRQLRAPAHTRTALRSSTQFGFDRRDERALISSNDLKDSAVITRPWHASDPTFKHLHLIKNWR